MAHSDDGLKIFHKEKLFQAIKSLNDSDHAVRRKGGIQLREEGKASTLARSKLRELIYDNDGCLRILAAEALSHTQSHPLDAVPVLETALDVGRSMEITKSLETWLRLCLGALYNFGDKALSAERSVWPYLHTQPNINLMLYATRVVSRFAKSSGASWTIFCLLCHHQDLTIRDYARKLMNSEEFKNYMKKDAVF
jgi:hypothetical protein